MIGHDLTFAEAVDSADAFRHLGVKTVYLREDAPDLPWDKAVAEPITKAAWCPAPSACGLNTIEMDLLPQVHILKNEARALLNAWWDIEDHLSGVARLARKEEAQVTADASN